MTYSVAFHTLDVSTPDGAADAYLAHPDDGRAHPGVLFLMDAFGLRPWLREMMEVVAAHGCTVLAPNVFFRSGRAPVVPMPDFTEPGARERFFADIDPVRKTLTPDLALRDSGVYLNWLLDSELVTPGGLGVVGYCMGARLALRIAGEFGPAIAAAACFHGGGLADDAPDSPHHAADRMSAELYIAHADNDRSMPRAQIATLDKTLDEAGARYTSVVYAGAAHGFTMRDIPVFDAEAYERHLRELFALFDRNLPFDPA
ncbi:dienelactone hydrolase family protein [Nocardia arizonensis]|uniref:dienelactone hydrolase family protein n=1 Tax=Nocardia arizonensis TaxID=1141647 RepID=UPI0006D26B29|nr:dienelactone hydrolase family protein [Nocardia arizonensis]